MKLFLLLLALILSAPCVLAQTHQHGSMPAGDGNFNPFVVSDNRGGFYLAFIQRSNGACNVMLRHSTDGRVFSEPVRVNSRESDATVRNENPPKLAVSPTGDVYVCWANERGKWKGDIRFARSTDDGKTFSPAITLNSDASAPPAGHAFQSIAVDRNGRAYVTWIDERNKKPGDRGAEIWMSTSEDRGKTFSRDRRILSDVCECCRTNIQIDSAGKLFLSYRTVPKAGAMYRDIIVARSADAGRSFETTTVSADGWDINACPVSGPALCLDSRDQVHVVWFTGGGDRPGLYYSTSGDHGASYSPRKLLDPDQRLGKHAQAVAQPGGKILVAWDDQLDGPVTFFGVLDPRTGLKRRSPAHARLSFPTLAANKEFAIVAGLAGAGEVMFVLEPLAGDSSPRK
ncbi:MAG: sialidase family protein [Acidobacteriota bacterium]